MDYSNDKRVKEGKVQMNYEKSNNNSDKKKGKYIFNLT
jgi:hypothetical protein